MIPFIIKSTLCLGVFLMIYILLLEKEKMHRFNRFYLLLSIIFSFVVPLIHINTSAETVAALRNDYLQTFDFIVSPATTVSANTHAEINYAPFILWTVYCSIAFLLLCRFVRNIILLVIHSSKNKRIDYEGVKLVLLKEKITSHSFLNTIFINEEEYNSQTFEKEILVHELTHVKQNHSWDIIFIELMQVIFWFNPFIIFYKKAIRINHEYLADDAVISTQHDIPSYQYLLLGKANLASSLSITSSFNYSITKKRLVMMTRQYSNTRGLLKKIIIIPVAVIVATVFSSRISAQNDPVKSAGVHPYIVPKEKEVPFSQNVISKAEQDELDAIVKKDLRKTKKGHEIMGGISDADFAKLRDIYFKMSKDQQANSKVLFEKKILHKMTGEPTNAQFQSWKDAAKYGVWVNEKKIKNDALNKYTVHDVGDYWVSNLRYTDKMKENVMKTFNLKTMYEKQLMVMTKDYADAFARKQEADYKENPYMIGYRIAKGVAIFDVELK